MRRLPLTVTAKVTRPLAYDPPGNRSVATWARLSFTTVDMELLGEVSRSAVLLSKIPQSGATLLDGFLYYLPDMYGQLPVALERNTIALALRMDAAAV